MTHKRYIIPIVAALLATPAWAEKPKVEQSKSSATLSEQQAKKDKIQVLDDAVKALRKTNLALQQLDQGKKKEALDTLALVTGKLELLVAQHPDMALAPVDVQMIVHDYVGTADSVKEVRKQAYRLLKDGALQQARHLIADVASEIVLRTTNLPLLTYPDAIKAVVPMIEKDDINAAKVALQNALSTVVVTDDIIPLPVLRAETALAEAKKLADHKNRDDKQAKALAELLDEAHRQLEWAETLGYGDKKSFKPLYDALDSLAEKTAQGGSEQGLFEQIKRSIEKVFR